MFQIGFEFPITNQVRLSLSKVYLYEIDFIARFWSQKFILK